MARREPANDWVLVFSKRSISAHVLDAFRAARPGVTVVQEQSYVPVHRLRRYHLRNAWRIVKVSGGHGSLIVLNAGAEVYVVALLLRLFPSRRRQRLVIADFLPSRHRWADVVQRFVLRRVDGWACIRSGDIAMLGRRYGVPAERCTFVRFPLTFDPTDPKAVRSDVTVDEPHYVYSAGDAFRDWRTVYDALELSPYPAVLCFRPDGDGAEPVATRTPPPRTLVMPRITAQSGRALAKGAMVVIVALQDTDLASGPSTLIDAMALGAAVVATDVNGTRDYVVDGETGRLITPGDAAALATVIDELVEDEAQCERLGRNAAAWAAEHLRPQPFAETLLALC